VASITFDCLGSYSSGNQDVGVLSLEVSISGEWLNTTIFASPIEITASIFGNLLQGLFIESSPIEITFSIEGHPLVQSSGFPWVKWSDVGNLDFTINKTNVAGERPLDWKGSVYALKKLGDKVMAYGENGVSILDPAGNYFGLETIYRIGLKGKHAVCGDKSSHYFIDDKGQLFRFSFGKEGLRELGYSEYLSSLSPSVVMNYDNYKKLIYICDGSQGFVYSPGMKSLGAGYPNISGFGYRGRISYFASPEDISIPTFEICTDIYDFGTRKRKTVHGLYVGTDVLANMQASIEYRDSYTGLFTATAWKNFDEKGRVKIVCSGSEFRFKVRLTSYAEMGFDYLKVNYIVHAH